MRPCEQGMYCKYEYFDYSENEQACQIDFDGTDCPYIKPYGKRKYYMDHHKERKEE